MGGHSTEALMTDLIMGIKHKHTTMRELFPFTTRVKGHFKIEFLSKGKTFEKSNTILPSAIEIMTGRLAGLASSAIDYIKIYNSSTLVASKLIQSTTKVSSNEVEFFTIFDAVDFSGDFDEAQLWCNSIGAFAGVTGLVQNKPADEQLAVTWKIKLV
jgi:hypothetical protein